MGDVSEINRPSRGRRRDSRSPREREAREATARSKAILAAIRGWTERYGAPPTLADWEPARARAAGQDWRIERFEAGDWPKTRTVQRCFGTMSAAITAAGLPARPRPTRVRPPSEGAESIVDSIRAWVERYGDTPGMADWDPPRARAAGHQWRVDRYYSGDWPRAATVTRHFGSWNAAIEAAGFRARPQGERTKAPPREPSPQRTDVDASTLVLRVRAVSEAHKSSDRTELISALRDLSSTCLDLADRLAA